MQPPDRPSEGNSMFGSLIFVLVFGLVVGGVCLFNEFTRRSQQLKEEKSAAQRQEADAQAYISELNNLAPGKIDEFNAGSQRRQQFVRDNPSFRDQLESAEDEWMKRTLDRTLADVEVQLVVDPAATIAELWKLHFDCQLDNHRLLPQIRQALERAAGSAAKRSADLLDLDNVHALDIARRCLAAFDKANETPPKTLTEARQRALDRCVSDLSERLHKIAVDDGVALASWLKARQAVEEAAGAAVPPLRQAEGRWLAGIIAAVLKEVEPWAAQQPEKAVARLEQIRTTYANLFADHPDAAKALTAGEDRCLQGVIDRAVAEARKQGNPVAASAQLRRTATVCATLLQGHQGLAQTLQEARREVVNKALKKASAEAYNLIKGDRFQAAASLAEQLSKDFGAEAEAVGLAAALVQLQDECGYYADLARQAGRLDPP
jgi:hypothetical protein